MKRKVENFVSLVVCVVSVTAYVQCDAISQSQHFSVARCNLKCRDEGDTVKCLKNCLAHFTKLGNCPTRDVPEMERLCVSSCAGDTDCIGVLKCCRHQCGITCMTPTGLDSVSEFLPPIPKNLSVQIDKSDISSEGFPITVRWQAPVSDSVQYIVQERHNFNGNDFDDNPQLWVVRRQTSRNSVTIKNLGRPGLWYQFCVYAVNANGTLGPSLPSTPFQLLPNGSKIKPDPPQDFRISAKSWGNGTFQLLLVWKKAPSVLPIIKYKVTWNRRENMTLFQYHHYLPKNVYHFWLRNVRPNTEYFLQVSAMVRYGHKKQLGEPNSIVFHTPDRPAPKQRRKIKSSEKNLKYKDTIKNVRVTSLYWLQEQLFANVSWQSIDDSSISYSVTWTPNTCCDKCKGWYVAKTEETNFQIYDLQAGCDYKISVKAIHERTLFEGNTILPSIKCDRDDLSQGFSDEIIKCPLYDI